LNTAATTSFQQQQIDERVISVLTRRA